MYYPFFKLKIFKPYVSECHLRGSEAVKSVEITKSDAEPAAIESYKSTVEKMIFQMGCGGAERCRQMAVFSR